MYQALAAELAAGGDQSVADSEVKQSIDQAPVAVRDLLRRMPPEPTSGSRMGVILSELDTALR
jgi:hypothetical protein